MLTNADIFFTLEPLLQYIPHRIFSFNKPVSVDSPHLLRNSHNDQSYFFGMIYILVLKHYIYIISADMN